MSSALQAINQSLPAKLSDDYISQVNTIPMLTAEQEHALALRWYEQQDVDAAKQLVMSHIRFVARIARDFSGYGLQINDLIQEGNIGLMKAVKRFNPHMGVRLVSFAVHWIKSEIHEYIIRNWRVVKIATTKAQRKLFFNLRSMKKRLGWFTEAEIKAVAHDLGVNPSDVREMEARLNAHDSSFDPQPSGASSSSDSALNALPAPSEYLEDTTTDPAELVEKSTWEYQANQQLAEGLKKLKDRERYVIEKRWLCNTKSTLQTLAQELNVSAERIRQIEQGALEKLKITLSSE